MINLQKIKRKYYQLIDTEGRKLNITMPSQGFLKKIIDTVNADLTEEEALEIMYELLLDILNMNTNGIEYGTEYVEQFDIQTAELIINDYTAFITEQVNL